MKPQAALRSRLPAPKTPNPDGSYFLSLTSVWSSKGRTGCGTCTRLRRTTAGLRLVRAVRADKRDHGSHLVTAGGLRGAVTVSFITAGFANAVSTAVGTSKQKASNGTSTWFCGFGLGVYMLVIYGLCDTSLKLQDSRLKEWKKNFLHLKYLPKKPRKLCRARTFLLSGFPKCLPSFEAAKLTVIPGEMEQSRGATPHAQQGTWLFLLLSSNHATPFLTVTQISFCRSTRAGKFIMHCGSGEISSFEKQTASTWWSFVGFSLTWLVTDYWRKVPKCKSSKELYYSICNICKKSILSEVREVPCKPYGPGWLWYL